MCQRSQFLVLGEKANGVNQWFEDEKIRAAWLTCMNGTDEALAMERFTLKDRYAIEESATAPGKELSHCCDGYLQAYCLIEETWIEIHERLAAEGFFELNEEHMAVLGAMEALTDWDQALERNENSDFLRSRFPLLFETLDESLAKLHRLALLLEDVRMQSESRPETFVREPEKIGRTGSCPCDSGKKDKKCCLN